MTDYTVTVSNIFEADTPEDALIQMAAWLCGYAYSAGYRVLNNDTGESVFLDAERVIP